MKASHSLFFNSGNIHPWCWGWGSDGAPHISLALLRTLCYQFNQLISTIIKLFGCFFSLKLPIFQNVKFLPALLSKDFGQPTCYNLILRNNEWRQKIKWCRSVSLPPVEYKFHFISSWWVDKIQALPVITLWWNRKLHLFANLLPRS